MNDKQTTPGAKWRIQLPSQPQTTKVGVAETEIAPAQDQYMDSSETRPTRPIQVSLEMIANLIYLSRHAETHSVQQHYYLDRAAEVMTEIAHHPKVDTWF